MALQLLRRIARVLAVASTASLLAIPAAVPVAATSPTIVEQTFLRHLFNQCPGFPIEATFFVDRTVTTYYDANGTPIRQEIHGNFPGEIMNLSTGNTLPANNVRQISIDLVTGEVRSTGTNVRVTIPGQGTLELVAGMQLTDATGHLLADGGRLDAPPTPELCAALAG